MAPDWFSLAYLKQGSPAQQRAFLALEELQLMENLQPFQPVLTGTFPLDLAIEGSDLDICCEVKQPDIFIELVSRFYGKLEGFAVKQKSIQQFPTILIRFYYRQLPFELFAQPVSPRLQFAFQHMLAEYELLKNYGSPLREKVLELKQKGYKTEAAFAKALGLTGDPYQSLLAFCP